MIIRVAASVVADFAAASTVEGDGKLMWPGTLTFFPKKSPIDEVLDFIEEKVPETCVNMNIQSGEIQGGVRSAYQLLMSATSIFQCL